jgi:hypothetical protein
MRDSTEMEIDPLSDVLRLIKAEPTVTGGFTAGGPWAIRFPARDKVKFFGVVRGECWARVEDRGEAVKFETGDVGLLAEQRPFVLSSAPSVTPVDAVTLFSGAGRTTAVIGDGSAFEHFGGHVLFDPAQASLVRKFFRLGSTSERHPPRPLLSGHCSRSWSSSAPTLDPADSLPRRSSPSCSSSIFCERI